MSDVIVEIRADEGGDDAKPIVQEQLVIHARAADAVLRDEPGGHRCQRVPPTEKRGRVHTSALARARGLPPALPFRRHLEVTMQLCRSLPLLPALAALAAVAGCTPAPGEDPSLLLGRVWVDSTPEKPTDYVHGAFFLQRPAIGVFQRASNYDFHFERFDYKREGQGVHFTFPQSGKTADVTYKVTACTERPPFDLCLDLSANPWGGPKRLYGIRQQDEDSAALRSIKAHLPAR